MARFAKGSTPWLLAPLGIGLFLAVFAFAARALWFLALAVPILLIFAFFLVFFRDPDRIIAFGVVSPADGKVVRLDRIRDSELGVVDRLSIFMSPKDVHVNRFPLGGKVLSVTHVPGSHMPAFNKDSDRNERVVTVLDTPIGKVKVVQIAGTVARRIVPYIAGGQAAVKGARMGLIRLGSRCDLLVPSGALRWEVHIGDQVHAGSTRVGEVLEAKP